MDITVDRINSMQSRIAAVLGTGYGQSLVSSQVGANATITAEQINNIYTDIVRARYHQIGDIDLIASVTTQNVIADDTSFLVGADGLVTEISEGTKQGILDYEAVLTRVEADLYKIFTGQATLVEGISSTRQNRWNEYLFHEVEITFTDATHLKNYFTAGGEIRFSSTLTTPVGAKSYDWQEMLKNIGTVQLMANETKSSGYGTYSSVGGLKLTPGESQIFQKIGSGASGVYSGNRYSITARTVDGNKIIARIGYFDTSADGRIDDRVVGTIESNVDFYRPEGPTDLDIGVTWVDVAAPAIATTIRLNSFGTPPAIDYTDPEDPTYDIDESTYVNGAYSTKGSVDLNEGYELVVSGRPFATYNLRITSPQNPTYEKFEDHIIQSYGSQNLFLSAQLSGDYYHTITFSNDSPSAAYVTVRVR